MVVFRIRGYKSDRNERVINDWYKQQDQAVKAKFDVRIKYLAERKRNEWEMPYFRLLHGPCHGLGEIRLKANKVHWRSVGFFSGPDEFTILIFVQEKGGRFQPKETCEIANRRKDQVLRQKEKYTYEWEIDI